MFDKKVPKTGGLDFGKTNRIVEGTIIKGDIISQADFRLDGELEGNFSSTGKIVIGPTGKVIGDIKCKNADVEGRFKGKMEVEELLSLKASASIVGEVITGKLSVEPGAAFTATCSMKNGVKQIAKVNEQQAG
ncbi:polymer-forming cytoskeletal protein [Flavobacterium arcticum]|uniref:Polymer-forming cytoskeletal protein n=1 Tax=Flavobacterium arcticum TaxID=1784713 RepID=A0A345HAV0_9FLAO|nr:polymer-forming cytoskeletal protein [Flavobacterium arcticum]AXG73710.1 polymer-forming cytoskeletal protein [Flavobacterium arcticum]KAF2511661.1 polymer-forming cytoskeletal protein [Flavobacterium arcticum]